MRSCQWPHLLVGEEIALPGWRVGWSIAAVREDPSGLFLFLVIHHGAALSVVMRILHVALHVQHVVVIIAQRRLILCGNRRFDNQEVRNEEGVYFGGIVSCVDAIIISFAGSRVAH